MLSSYRCGSEGVVLVVEVFPWYEMGYKKLGERREHDYLQEFIDAAHGLLSSTMSKSLMRRCRCIDEQWGSEGYGSRPRQYSSFDSASAVTLSRS